MQKYNEKGTELILSVELYIVSILYIVSRTVSPY